MPTINIPPKFSDLEALDDEILRKIVRMATAVLSERAPVSQPTGRKSNSKEAFESVPTTPTDAEEFAKHHNISINTLRQQGRFDPLKGAGVGLVYIKKSKQDGRLYVWRGDPNALKDFESSE